MKLFKSWAIPLIISIGLFFVIRPVLAQTVEIPHDVTVGTVSGRDNFSQIYYEFNGVREVITDNRYTNASPVSAGEYIVWVSQINGLWQVFLYDLTAKITTQLTFVGNNVNSKVEGKGRVVWEGWDGATWQIFFFDGSSTRQLTTGDTSLNPDINGDYISYGRRDISGTWRAVIYSMKDDKSVDVTVGEKARNPKIRNGEIYLAFGSLVEEKFPLSVADLFLLNLTPLTASASASVEASTSAIVQELSATASAVAEVPLASPSPSPSPESTPSGQPEASPTPGI